MARRRPKMFSMPFDERPEALRGVRIPLPEANGGGAHRDRSKYTRKRKHKGGVEHGNV